MEFVSACQIKGFEYRLLTIQVRVPNSSFPASYPCQNKRISRTLSVNRAALVNRMSKSESKTGSRAISWVAIRNLCPDDAKNRQIWERQRDWRWTGKIVEPSYLTSARTRSVLWVAYRGSRGPGDLGAGRAVGEILRARNQRE